MFVVDGSPPECAYDGAKTFGEGHVSTVQANAGRLTIGFKQALWDEHTGLQGARYALEVAGAEQLTPLPWAAHDGRAPTKMTIYNLSMTHGRRHRVLAEGINGVGLVTEWCPSPWVLVDLTPPISGSVIVVQTSDEAFPVVAQSRTDRVYMTLRDFNDPESVRTCFEMNPGQVACVILEPVAGNMGVVEGAQEFIEHVRDLCSVHGALLIFDEVMTGFRITPTGAQGYYGEQQLKTACHNQLCIIESYDDRGIMIWHTSAYNNRYSKPTPWYFQHFTYTMCIIPLHWTCCQSIRGTT